MHAYAQLTRENREVADARAKELLARGVAAGPIIYRWIADTLERPEAVAEMCSQDEVVQLMTAAVMERVIALTSPTAKLEEREPLELPFQRKRPGLCKAPSARMVSGGRSHSIRTTHSVG